jgi:hypothetical protein
MDCDTGRNEKNLSINFNKYYFGHIIKLWSTLMYQIKKGLLSALTTLLLCMSVPQAAFAQCGAGDCGYQDCCMEPHCEGDYMLGIDFLWWKPCISDLDFAGTINSSVVNEITNTDFKYKGICPDWTPGIRLTFDYPDLFCWCNIGLSASYTYLDMDEKHVVNGDENVYLLFHPGIDTIGPSSDPVHGKWYCKYQTWDALFYYNCCCSPCVYITPYIGVAGIMLTQDLKSSAVFADNSFAQSFNTKWKSTLWGVGLKSGLAVNYNYSRCLGFYSFASGTILSGKSHTKHKSELRGEFDNTLRVRDDDCCTCIPGVHIGVGAKANFCICGYAFSMRLGYEFLEWYNLPKHRIFTGDNIESEIGSSSSSRRTLGFHGPFLGAIFYF